MIILHQQILLNLLIGKKIIVLVILFYFLFYFILLFLANYIVFTYKQTGRVQLYDIQKNKSVELSTVK